MEKGGWYSWLRKRPLDAHTSNTSYPTKIQEETPRPHFSSKLCPLAGSFAKGEGVRR
jgi:hypothetical protein